MDTKIEIKARVVNCKETKNGSGIYFLCLQAKEFKNLNPGPGQFVTLEPLKKTSTMLRPFTVAWHTGYDKIWLYINVVGDDDSNTRQYAKLKKKDRITVSSLRGKRFCPPNKINDYVLVGGGVGTATLFLLAKELKEKKKNVNILVGAKNELGIIGPDLFRTLEIEPRIITENANVSYNQGLATDLLEDVLIKKESPTAVIACGPRLMLKKVSEICYKHNCSCFVAVEEIMACSTGSCKGCAIKGIDGTYKYVCLDGPIFSASWIDWKKFMLPQASTIVHEGKKITSKPMQVSLEGKEGRSFELLSPLMNASGCLGIEEAQNNSYLDKAGALVTKGIMLEPRGGNSAPRVCEIHGGMINAIGLAGIGIKNFVSDELPIWLNSGKPVIVNIAGETIEEYEKIAAKLASSPIDVVEINISCPNIKKGSMAFGTDSDQTFAVVSKIRKKLPKKFLIAKLTPNVTDIVQIAKAAVRGGVDALSMINTVSAMVIDIHTRRPLIGNNRGGLSGQTIKPIGIVAVNRVFLANLGVPIIGMGGIKNGKDALEYIIAGASAVMVGTEWFSNKTVFSEIHDTILDYLKKYDINRIQDLTGTLKFYR